MGLIDMGGEPTHTPEINTGNKNCLHAYTLLILTVYEENKPLYMLP